MTNKHIYYILIIICCHKSIYTILTHNATKQYTKLIYLPLNSTLAKIWFKINMKEGMCYICTNIFNKILYKIPTINLLYYQIYSMGFVCEKCCIPHTQGDVVF